MRDVPHRLDQARAAALAVAKGDRRVPVGRRQRMRQHRLEARQQRLGARRSGAAAERFEAMRGSLVAAVRRRRARSPPAAPRRRRRRPRTARSLGAGAHRMHAGEGAERGQHADLVAEPEARQAQVVVRAPADADARVQVAGQHVGAGDAARGWWHSAKPSRAQRLVDDRGCRASAAGRRRGRRGCRAPAPARARVRARARRPPRASVAGACARAECRKSPRKTIAPRAGAPHQRRQAGERLARSCRAAPARRGRGSSPPCRCAHRRPAACALAAMNAAFSGSRVSGRPPARIVVTRARLRTRQADEQAQRDVEVLGRAAAEARAREALQAADRERGQRRGLRVGIDRRRGRARGLGARRAGSGAAATRCGRRTGSCAPCRRSFSNTSASPTITRVMPGFFSPNCSSTVRIRCACASALGLALERSG